MKALRLVIFAVISTATFVSLSYSSCDLAEIKKIQIRPSYQIQSSPLPHLNQHTAEQLAETAAIDLFCRNGFGLLPSKINGNQGVDLVFCGQMWGHTVAVVHESKYLASSGGLRLRQNADICDQMTRRWVWDRIRSMLGSEDREVVKTGQFLARFHIENIVRTANVRDGSDNTNSVYMILEAVQPSFTLSEWLVYKQLGGK